jgi:N6-L-threonylcarbamoyladenine synthase
MLTLGIETSCDETSAAVLAGGRDVLANIISSQHNIHAAYGGVVPELACRSHTENIRPVVETALQQAGVTLRDIDLIGVTQGPGLVGALLIGLSFAKSLAYGLGRPLVGVHHLDGHVSAIYLGDEPVPCPFVALVVSGGHSDLYYCPQRGRYDVLGRTRDDAAGECFDKVAKMLSLGYPGGPVVDRLAEHGNPAAVHFPRAMQRQNNLDFSFSGVKAAVRSYLLDVSDLHGQRFFQDDSFWPLPDSPQWEQDRNDILASFQEAVVDALVSKTIRAVEQTKAEAIAVVGGVACNTALRRRVALVGESLGLPVLFPSPILCTDNAAMIAAAAAFRYEACGELYQYPAFLDLDARPNLDISELIPVST